MATERIIGNYRIEEMIGRGGMGIVYRAHHLQLPREVAIKSIDTRDKRDLLRLKSRFEKEAYIQSQLDHPGIVKVYDYIVEERSYYIVMEYVEGRSLAQLLAREASPIPPERALDLFEQILSALAYAQAFVYRDQDGSMHHGLIHRDLKPGNILISPGDHVKITDFGIVKLSGSDGADTLGGVYGSPEYVSPEQAEGKKVDQRSDIYSLGIILYELLTGAPPFYSKDDSLSHTDIARMHVERAPAPPRERNAQVTPEMEAIILRAIEKSPERRFNTAQEFLDALRRVRIDGAGRRASAGEVESRAESRVRVDESAATSAANETQARESYETQRIGARACDACGAAVGPNDKRCHECGHYLTSSPATVELTRAEVAGWRKRRRLDLWLAVLLTTLAAGSLVIYFARRGAAPPKDAPQVVTQTPEAHPSTPPQPAALFEVKPSRVEVDSNFDGYDSEPLTDGETDVRRIAAMKYNKGNWASAETEGPHWIEITFERPLRLAALYIYWGFDRNRFMPSRSVELQVPEAPGSWRTVSTMQPGNDHDRMAFDFAPFETSRVRLFQPSQQGPASRPFVMWVREVKTFAVEGAQARP